VQYQRGQDALLSDACRDANVAGTLTLIKNDRDSRGNVYGAQENYELSLARGAGLFCWRAGLVLLFPLLLLGWIGHLLLIVSLVGYLIVAGLLFFLLQFFLPAGARLRVLRTLLGEEFADSGGYAAPVPGWLEAAVLWIVRIVTGPFALALYLLVRLTAFRAVRRDLMPFLVTRPLLAGAGLVTDKGGFRLSDKADAINCRLGFNGMIFDRPVFSIGHLFKALMFRAWSSPREYARLFEPRHRLQVCLGDSNMAEEAEFLRVGATMLVIDAIEAGALAEPPVLRRAIRTLHTVCGDVSFRQRYAVGRGRWWSAVEIQRYYLDACRSFVESNPDAPPDAHDLVRRWGEVLDAIETEPRSLVGRLDWATKRYLLHEAGADAEQDQLRKIDIRYHELSTDGYANQLRAAGMMQAVLTEDEIERATRTAPPDTPAAVRSRYIREFAAGDVPFRVNWHTVTLGTGPTARVIELTRPAEP
jgi:proteasome accessory factor A